MKPYTIEELMKPRWEVMMDYPLSIYKVGQILQKDEPIYDAFPDIFRRMDWHEQRTVEALPRYLKTHGGIVFKTLYRRSKSGKLQFTNPHGDWGKNSTLSALLPATEEEFEAYQSSKPTE